MIARYPPTWDTTPRPISDNHAWVEYPDNGTRNNRQRMSNTALLAATASVVSVNVSISDRTLPIVSRYAAKNTEAVMAMISPEPNAAGVNAIIMACNTSCATAAEFGWPHSQAPVLDLIESAAIAVESGGYLNVGVVATAATARSGAYAEAIGALCERTHVTEIGAPALVPLVEARKIYGEEPRAAVAAVCANLPRDVDSVVLACTHYPLLESHFAAVLGPDVALIDPALVHAERAVRLVAGLGIPAGSGATLCMTSGNLEAFRENLITLVGDIEPAVLAASWSDGVGAAIELAREGAGG